MSGRPTPERLVPDRTLIVVALKLIAIYAVLQALLWVLIYGGHFGPALTATAKLTGAAANAIGIPAKVVGNDIFLSNRILRIDSDCTGVTLMMVYSALVLAYPLRWRRKLAGVALGVPAIAIANFGRLLAVAALSAPLGDRAFLFVHDYLFKILMVAVVIAVWAAYLAWARRHA